MALYKIRIIIITIRRPVVAFTFSTVWQVLTVGGVAQWLGRRPLAGGLSLTYARSVVDR